MNKARREWYEGTYLYTEHWHGVKQVVRKRNGGRCERCNAAKINHVHHLTYDYLWHELDHPTCVQGVCRECHEFAHGKSTHDPANPEGKCENCGGLEGVVRTKWNQPICGKCMRERRLLGW